MIEEECKRLGFGEPDIQNLNIWIQQQTADSIPEWNWSNETKSFTFGLKSISELQQIKFRTYGTIYFVYYQGAVHHEYAFMKFKLKKQDNLIREGLIQSIIRNTLNTYGFDFAVPRVHTFIRHLKWGLGLCLERIPKSHILSDYLQSHIQWNIPCAANDKLFLSILLQLATYLAILQKEHQFIHGDLKSTNVLLIVPCPTFTKSISIHETLTWTFSASFKLTLIDFGFAKFTENSTPTIQSRDLFFFLCTLWNIPQFRKSLTPKMINQIRRWLHDETDWAKWLEFSVDENIHGMYLLTGSTQFRNTNCTPIQILTDIQTLYPELITLKLSSN